MLKKIFSKLIYLKKISSHLKSIDFWTIVGSVATVLGLIFAILTYQSQSNSNLNNAVSNINAINIDTIQKDNRFKKNKLTIGVVNAVGKEKYIKCYTPFVKYISEKLDFDDYELKILDYKEISGELLNNKIDIGIFRFCSIILVVIKTGLPNFRHLFLYRFGKFLFRLPNR